MSTADDDERRRRSLEAGREMLEKYKAERASKSRAGRSQMDEASDDEQFQNDKTSDHQESCVHEAISSRDVTQSSVSEGEGDGDLEGLAGRVAELEELLQGKEAVVEALNAEIDQLRAEASSPNSSQSQNSSVHGRDVISLYHTKLQEFEKAINQRDNLIEDLTWSLEQTLSARDGLLAQLNSLNAVQIPPNTAENMDLQEKINTLEATLSDQKSMIVKLNGQLTEIQEHVQTLEIEKETRNAEISDYKLQINNLNEQIRAGATEKNLNIAETLEQQRQYETRVDKIKQDMQHIVDKFTAETNANTARHQQELKDLAAKHEAEMADVQQKYEESAKSLQESNKAFADRLNKELPDLESRHAKELLIFQTQLAHYKRTVKALKLELENRSESQRTALAQANLYKARLDELKVRAENAERVQELNHQKEKEMLSEQIKLHKLQLEELTSQYLATSALLESKESIERSLEEALTNSAALKEENDALKFKLNDLSSRYSAAQSLIENSQLHERSLTTRIFDLEKSLSRVSGVNVSTLSELNETSYPSFDEVAFQYQFTRQKLDEKAELEKMLVEKMRTLEETVRQTTEELERANLARKSYEKQLKDVRNTCDKYHAELESLKGKSPLETKPQALGELLRRTEEDRREIERLTQTVRQKEAEIADYAGKLQELTEQMKSVEEESGKLKAGLAAAWAQCAEVEEKLNQTLALNESRFDASNTLQLADTTRDLEKREANDKSLRATTEENEKLLRELELLGKKQSDYEELRAKLEQLAVENKALKAELENARALQEAVDRLQTEKESLQREIEALVFVHDEQIDGLRVENEAEVKKMQSLLLTAKEGGLEDVKRELEERHAKEVEELRTYFEEKCLQMEKQYSEEVFSQQSKKVSDNDSEIADLTDGLFYGGAGDCLNASDSGSRVGTPEQLKHDGNDGKDEYEAMIRTLQQELEKKIREIEDVKLMYEKKLNERNVAYEREIAETREKKGAELLRTLSQHCQTEWDAGALENGELSKLRAAYSHQLEEQIALARLDIVNALQEEIQALLAVETDSEDNWPPELLELRDKFTNNAKREIQQLKEKHAADLLQMGEEHSRNIARIIDRHQEELSQMKTEKSQDGVAPQESSSLNKTIATFKVLVEELIKYLAVCEEEVNNTLISEVLKRQLSETLCNADKTQETVKSDSNVALIPEMKIKRVHFAPQSSEIVSIMRNDADTLRSIFEEDDGITEKLKQELNGCLRRLKTESAEILGASFSDGSQMNTISEEIMWMNKVNEELNSKLGQARELIMRYQLETEQLKENVLELQRKLVNAENKKEIITEGYGEHDDTGGDITMQDFSQLQEKARHVLSNGGGDCTYLLQLIEELCRQSDKLMEDARKEKEDLQQQIEAADKQLKGTRRFLDEQASEREAERDEHARQIHLLQEQIKEREREKERDSRISSETSLSPEPTSEVPVLGATEIRAAVEALESQMREMSSMMSDTEAKKTETESELKAATEKIWVLRDIITELEQQLQTKTENEDSLQVQINQLETVITAQTKHQNELVQELEAVKMGSEIGHLNEHVGHLQEELRKHQLSSEQFNVNSQALKQMKLELREMQTQLDKRIKDLESVHMCGSNLSLSQPSEDVSIREQIDASRCPTPDDPTSPPMLPLDQLLKLKEKMLKHARAEEVAFKRIKDLEMQLTAFKNQNEELQAEQEILQQTASEQLYQIEVMRGRLEQQKQSAPFAQRQATSRLELQLHEATTNFHSLEQAIADKDMELVDMKNQLNRVNQLLLDKETEIENVVQMEKATIKKLKERLELAEEEKQLLQVKVGVHEHAQLELPRLMDSMLADKNEEIDHLKDQLSKKEKQLEVYTSLTVDDGQLREMMRQAEAKNSARTLSDILSIHSECEEMPEAIRAGPNVTLLPNISAIKVPALKDTLDASATPLLEISKMGVQIPPLDLGSRSQSLSQTSSGTESKTSSPEKVEPPGSPVRSAKQTQTSINETIKEIDRLHGELAAAREEARLTAITLEKREADFDVLQKLHEELQAELKESMENLARDKSFYQSQYESCRTSEGRLQKSLHQVENLLKQRTDEVEDFRSKMQVNEKIITELSADNARLRKELEDKQTEEVKKYTGLLQEKAKELQNLKDAILEKDITIETIQTRNVEIEEENKQLYEYKTQHQSSRRELAEAQSELQRLTAGLNNRDEIIRRLEEMARRSSFSGTSTPSDEKDQEIHHLQEYLKEKDKVIRQMSDDSRSLHRALETIQNKMKESGNVVELRKKLKEERKLTAELQEIVEKLGNELNDLKLPRRLDEGDIEDMVQRELNLSAHLDRQIMNAIESDEGVEREGLQKKLSQSEKANEELKRFKDDLEIERGMLQCQVAEYESRIFQLKSDLAEEARKVAKLDKELSDERNHLRALKIDIDRDRRAAQSGQCQDAELIEFLQDKLKAAAENEMKLRGELTALRQEQRSLEAQLTAMKEAIESRKPEDLPKIADLLEEERRKYVSLMEQVEKEERKGEELRSCLKKVQMEKDRYEKQLEVAIEEKEKLISSLALVEGVKDHQDTDLRRTKEELKAREEECEWLQKRIQTMNEAEGKRQERTNSEHNEVRGLRRELSNAREVMTDLEADLKQWKRELTESLEREMKLAETLQAVKEREADLANKLSVATEEEKKLKQMVSDLQKELTIEFMNDEAVPAKFAKKIKDLSDTNERYSSEHFLLRDKYMKAIEEKDGLIRRLKSCEAEAKQSKLSQETISKNLQHFYGKHLRVDSRRKALTFQKRYLLNIIGGYEISEESTLHMLAQLTRNERAYANVDHNRKSPKVRFRSAVIVLISIHRMKWLILRWRIGKRTGSKALIGNIDQSFAMPGPRPTVNYSPPVRERPTSNGLGGFALEQYYQRIKSIQETLGLAMSEPGSRQIIPE